MILDMSEWEHEKAGEPLDCDASLTLVEGQKDGRIG